MGKRELKCSVLLAAVLAVALMAVPAVAQDVDQETRQEAESGDVTVEAEVAGESGNSVEQCAALLQAAQAGNAEEARSVLQYDGTSDEVEFGEGGISLSPALEAACKQTIEQASRAASETGRAVPDPPETRAPDAKAGDTETGEADDDAETEADEATRSETKSVVGVRELPKTGGSTLALKLGAVVLLIGGSILVCRIFR